MPLDQGYVQIYTGNSKGKTTAALGLALRAVGRGLRVCMIQFMKGGGPYGEHSAAARLAPDLEIIPTGRSGWVNRQNPDPEDVRCAHEALLLARRKMEEGEWDILILDEICGAIDFGLISIDEVLSLVDRKPPRVELVLTGRNAHPSLLERADLVTEMREVKHYYKAGVPARIGIEK
ncbi:MAG: cob(I)yrinic acid a,c-diamide adenosyltransferase [Desulfuromonadia bacterium]